MTQQNARTNCEPNMIECRLINLITKQLRVSINAIRVCSISGNKRAYYEHKEWKGEAFSDRNRFCVFP